MASAPREVMRLARKMGGTIEKAVTRYDEERGGRVLELVVLWPGDTGYENTLNAVDNGGLAQ